MSSPTPDPQSPLTLGLTMSSLFLTQGQGLCHPCGWLIGEAWTLPVYQASAQGSYKWQQQSTLGCLISLPPGATSYHLFSQSRAWSQSHKQSKKRQCKGFLNRIKYKINLERYWLVITKYCLLCNSKCILQFNEHEKFLKKEEKDLYEETS